MYKGLSYKTLGNTSPQGKSKVYFCCHPDDYAQFFDSICDDIRAVQSNVAVWYYDYKNGLPEKDELLSDLKEMQLFVIPVTSSFLFQSNMAREVELVFAIENHIPVLPLMQDSGLEDDFNRICGNLHVLDKNSISMDVTALSYEDRFKDFLQSVLLGEDLKKEIRESFDAYLFLSYRKKDRAYAQRLMRVIHSSEDCRDIAIWYDEFLVPGEDFDNAIFRMMDNSDLFLLAVTPSLLETPNYVMEKEYPAARSKNMPILPVMLAETDKKTLGSLYSGIPDTVTDRDPDVIAERIRELMWGVSLRSSSGTRHSLLIGLAYLSGVDIEINHELAVSLITEAANAGNMEACKKLATMYATGEGVERDYSRAINWKKKHIDLLHNLTFSKQSKNKNVLGHFQDVLRKCRVLFSELMTLWNLQTNVGDYDGANETVGQMNNVIRMINAYIIIPSKKKRVNVNKALATLDYYQMVTLALMGSTQEELGRKHEAAVLFEKASQKGDAIIKREPDKHASTVCKAYLNASNFFYKEDMVEKADQHVEKALQLINLQLQRGDWKKWKDLESTALELKTILNLEQGKDAEALEDAKKMFFAAENYKSELGNDQDTYRNNLAAACTRMSAAYRGSGKIKSAIYFGEEAARLREEQTTDSPGLKAWDSLVSAYRNQSVNYEKNGQHQEAKDYAVKAVKIHQQYLADQTGVGAKTTLLSLYIQIGKECINNHEEKEAIEWLEKGRQLGEQLRQNNATAQAERYLFYTYNFLELANKKLGDPESEARWREKAAAQFYARARKLGNP